MSFDTCTQVSDICPVEATTLGYYPNLGANIFFATAFGICLVAAAVLGVWTYGAAITVGLLMELAGMLSPGVHPHLEVTNPQKLRG